MIASLVLRAIDLFFLADARIEQRRREREAARQRAIDTSERALEDEFRAAERRDATRP